MSRPARILVVLATLLLSAMPLCAQDPDVDAVLNALFAKDLNSAVRYAPPEIQVGISRLSKSQRRELATYVPFIEVFKQSGVTIKRPSQGDALFICDDADGEWFSHLEFYLDRRECERDQSTLTLRVTDGASTRNTFIAVRLKYIYPEWRIYEIGVVGEHETFNWEKENVASKFLEDMREDNERAARQALREYVHKISEYVDLYPAIGVPSSLEALGAPEEGSTPTPAHAGLVSRCATDSPFICRRYRFEYRRRGFSEFSITARPVRFGLSGNVSYFIDESGILRSTSKNEAANENSDSD